MGTLFFLPQEEFRKSLPNLECLPKYFKSKMLLLPYKNYADLYSYMLGLHVNVIIQG